MSQNANNSRVTGPQPPVRRVPDAGNVAVGRELVIPAPHSGRTIVEPERWAQLVLNADFSSVRKKNHSIKSDIVRQLLSHTPLREPLLHTLRPMTAAMLNAWLNQKKANFESALITVVGVVTEDEDSECTRCQKGKGVWARCVSIQGADGRGLACNNCHQVGVGARCESYVPPANQPANQPATARTSRQSRGQSAVEVEDVEPADEPIVNPLMEELHNLIRQVCDEAYDLEEDYDRRRLRYHDLRDHRRTAVRLRDVFRRFEER